MIDHLSTYSTDYEATKSLYEAALSALGYRLNVEMVADWDPDFPTRKICAFGEGDKPCFWLVEVPEDHATTPRHVAFSSKDRAGVDAFHAAALAAGGKDNGAPGPREIYHPDYYGAFAPDPDGNNVEAVCHLPE